MSYTIIKDPALEPFFISKDQYCYTVYENVTPDPENLEKGAKGKEYQKAVGHYGKFQYALKCIAKQKLNYKNTQYNSIKEYMNQWNQLQEEIEQLLNKLEI